MPVSLRTSCCLHKWMCRGTLGCFSWWEIILFLLRPLC